MREKNGFTTVELITTFALVMTITLLLFELVVSLKQIYVNVALKSLLLNKQAIMEQKIYDDFNNKKIKIASKCGENCLTFFFEDNSQATLKIDRDTNLFTYGDYTIKLDDNSYFGNINVTNKVVSNVAEGKNNAMIIINIPIESTTLEGNYGVMVLYQYDSRETAIGDIAFENSTIDNNFFLKGSSEMAVIKGTEFKDPGYYTIVGDEIISNDTRVEVSGSVNHTLVGDYEIVYKFYIDGELKETKIRKVTVFEKVTDFSYTGAEQAYTVPASGYYKIELWGASGGSSMGTGGKGAYVSGEIYLNKNETLYFYVGQYSSYVSSSCYSTNSNNSFNGNEKGSCVGGGGATDVRLVSDVWYNFDSLKTRIMVAAGGGGAYYSGSGGYGGTLTGGAGIGNSSSSTTTAGLGGSQTSSSFGVGTAATSSGGGGYYGGNGYSAGNSGGGSSFISGYSGCNAISESSTSSNIIHTGQPNHYSGKVFNNAQMIAGNDSMPNHDGSGNMTGNSGNGYAKITYLR